MTGLQYELVIKLGRKYYSVTDKTMKGLLKKAESLVGDDLWSAQLEIGIEGGGTQIKNFTVRELEILASKGTQIGKLTKW